MSFSYIPTDAHESSHYETLWQIASPSGLELSGLQAVNFFKQSAVDINILKQIWGFSTPVSTMNKTQFYCALRYIAMFQNGDVPITKERLQASANRKMNLPKFADLVIPPSVAYSPNNSNGGDHNNGNLDSARGAGNYPPITPEVHIRYHDLFVQYDTDKDG